MSLETPGSTPAAAPAAAAPVAAAPPPPPTSTPTPQPTTVTIPLEQLQTFTSVQARLAQLESEQAQRDAASRAEQVRLLAAKGEVENAFKIQREEAQKAIDIEKSAPRRHRGASQAVRSRRRARPRAVRAAARPRRRGAAHSSLARPVRRRTAGRILSGPHADVPVGRRLRRGDVGEARVCSLCPRVEPGRRHRRQLDVGGDERTDAGPAVDAARAQELRRGDHSPDPGQAGESAGRPSLESSGADGPEQSLVCPGDVINRRKKSLHRRLSSSTSGSPWAASSELYAAIILWRRPRETLFLPLSRSCNDNSLNPKAKAPRPFRFSSPSCPRPS